MNLSKKNIYLFLLLFFILIVILIVIKLYFNYGSVNYQMKMLKKGNTSKKIAATNFMKENKITKSIQLIIDNLDSREIINLEDETQLTLPCVSVQALEWITEEKATNLNVCEERIYKYDDHLNSVKNDWQNWYWNQQYPDWQVYRNHTLGFEIKYPKTIFRWGGSCSLENGLPSINYGQVPVKIFEAGNNVFISQQYLYKIIDNKCVKSDNSLALLENEYLWKIIIKNDIYNDKALNEFIKEFYIGFGGDCSSGEKKPTAQPGVYDILTNYDGKDLGESDCFINGWSVFKYYPEKEQAAAWLIGQEPIMLGNQKGTFTFDKAMVDSFRFIE